MTGTKTYTCGFMIPNDSIEWTPEDEFELTDKELQQAIDALEEYDNRFNDDLLEAMYDAVWDVA